MPASIPVVRLDLGLLFTYFALSNGSQQSSEASQALAKHAWLAQRSVVFLAAPSAPRTARTGSLVLQRRRGIGGTGGRRCGSLNRERKLGTCLLCLNCASRINFVSWPLNPPPTSIYIPDRWTLYGPFGRSSVQLAARRCLLCTCRRLAVPRVSQIPPVPYPDAAAAAATVVK